MIPQNLAWIRSLKLSEVPEFGARLYQSIKSIGTQVTNLERQGNLNSQGQPITPPNIQSVAATGQNGVLHVSIQDQSSGLNRGVNYYVEHADNPSFVNAQIRNIGDSRSYTEFIGNATRYVRAYSAYPGSANSSHAYHGSASAPAAVSGGGSIGPPSYLPSQGSGTGAAGQSGFGPGPSPTRSEESGFNWRLQRATTPGGFNGAGTPAGNSAFNGGGASGGGGGGSVITEAAIAQSEWLTGVAGTNTITASTAISYAALAAGFMVRVIPANTNSGAVTLNVNSIGAHAITKNGTTALAGGEMVAGHVYLLVWDGTEWQLIGAIGPASATVLASNAAGVPTAAPLASGDIWVGNGSNLPAAVAVSGDFTLSNTGVGTLDTVNGSPGTYGDATHVAQVTVNGKGLVTSASSVPITFPGSSGYSGSVALAALTALGTQGSLTVVNGLITAYTPPT